MKYIKPNSHVEKALVANMLAESLPINEGTTVDGGGALTKEADWAVWGNDNDPEE